MTGGKRSGGAAREGFGIGRGEEEGFFKRVKTSGTDRKRAHIRLKG